MLNSVRARLTLWYTGVLALVLALFGVAVYMVVEREAFARLDAGLHAVLQVTRLSLQHEIEEHEGQAKGEDSFRLVMRTMHHATFPRQAIGVFRDGQLVASKTSFEGLQAPDRASAPQTPRFETRGSHRIAAVAVTVPYTGASYRIVAAERMQDVFEQLRSLRAALFVAVPATLLLAAAVGYLMARKSLAPVVAMSEHVDRISSVNLAARLAGGSSRDELGRLAGTFNRLLERLEGAFSRQRQFMADASHELRTPVSVARTAAQVTLEAPARSEAEYREALGIIDQQMTRLTRIVNDLFLLARADAGAATVQKKLFYLDETLRDTVQAARVLAGDKRVTVACGELPEAPAIGDEDLVRQLALILLDNAVKYTPAGGQVTIGFEAGNEEYRISVADTGIGIPPDAQGKIFERFFRVDKARSRAMHGITGGAGLGLSIGRWIAEAHGGSVELARSGPDGTEFVVSLPKQPAKG